MTEHYNNAGQPIGAPVPNWRGCAGFDHTAMHGRTCDLIPLHPDHSAELHAAFSADQSGMLWTYMPEGPFNTEADYATWVAKSCQSKDPLFFTITDKSRNPLGVASYLRIQPENGVVEVGYITFSPALKRTAMATEAMYLMMKRAFVAGYRRYEWKCDALNAASRKAAQRLGFQYEGTFRQAVVYKGRNRDTAWFAITDNEWPEINAGFESWLHPDNFDANGQQSEPLNVQKTAT